MNIRTYDLFMVCRAWIFLDTVVSVIRNLLFVTSSVPVTAAL